MQIKLIASDLDGTLLNEKKEITERTARILNYAVSQGIVLVPATGRAYHAVPDHVTGFPGVKYVITSNGASIYLVPEDLTHLPEKIYRQVISEASVRKLLALNDSPTLAMEVFIDGQPYTERRNWDDPAAFGATEFGVGYVKRTRLPVDNWDEFVLEHASEMENVTFVSADHAELGRLADRMRSQMVDIYITSSFPHLLEIGDIDTDKGKTLKRLMEMLGIRPEEAVAFGDGENDMEMLQSVKYGVAMGNASDKVKSAASYVTAENEEDGVAQFLETLIFH